jgi:mannose-6-phosphate isomerase-like protein (cupin superfamily)
MASPISLTFDALEIARGLEAGGYEVFHETEGVQLGIYVLAAPEPDTQKPHEWDELYLVLEGSGTLEVEGEEIRVEEGSTAFVKAGADHRFKGYERMTLLVVFDKSRTA